MRSKAAPKIVEYIAGVGAPVTSKLITEYLMINHIGEIKKREGATLVIFQRRLIAVNLLLNKMVAAGMLKRGQRGKSYTYSLPDQEPLGESGYYVGTPQ